MQVLLFFGLLAVAQQADTAAPLPVVALAATPAFAHFAPGEKILSCAAGKAKAEASAELAREKFDYLEQSGTSMAAPHVSGVVAAFLSVRREFIGQPEKVKQIFVKSASDLGRDRYFQGSGLVDLMRAIQTV